MSRVFLAILCTVPRASALFGMSLSIDTEKVRMPDCQIAPVYRSNNTSTSVMGVTVLGDAFVAIRDAKHLFTVRRTHLDLGNWSLAVGTLRGGMIEVQEGFEGPGIFRAANDSRFCQIVWERARDVWLPVEPQTSLQLGRLSVSSYAMGLERARAYPVASIYSKQSDTDGFEDEATEERGDIGGAFDPDTSDEDWLDGEFWVDEILELPLHQRPGYEWVLTDDDYSYDEDGEGGGDEGGGDEGEEAPPTPPHSAAPPPS